MTRMTRKILILVLLLAIVVAALVYFGPLSARQPGDDGSLTLYGNVDIRELALSFRVGGRLSEARFEEGDPVAAGQIVATLEDTPYRDELAVAEARVSRARAQLSRLEAGSRPQVIRQARARVDEATAAFDNAVRELERKEPLVDSGATSERDLDAARARREESAARLDSAREQLALAEEGVRAEEIEAGRAELVVARAQLDQSRTALADTELVAPTNGVILVRALEPGSMVAAGGVVYTVSLSEAVYVRAYVAGPELGNAVPGREVTLTTDSSDRVYSGQIGFVSARAEFTPKSVETPELRTDLVYRLRIVVADPDDALRQGMPVTVRLPKSAEGA